MVLVSSLAGRLKEFFSSTPPVVTVLRSLFTLNFGNTD